MPAGGEYYGPNGWNEFTGWHPVQVRSTARSRDLKLQQSLWHESERLTDVHYDWSVTQIDTQDQS